METKAIINDTKIGIIYEIQNEKWYCGKYIADKLGYKKSRNAINKHIDDNDKLNHETLIKNKEINDQKKFPANTIFINSRGVKTLVIKSRLPNAINIAKELGLDVSDIKITYHEQKTLNCIMEAFKNEKMERQYSVGKYRIDLYFPDYKIAVECDENDHQNYNKDNDKERTQYINDKLHCSWVRYNPDDKNFNIFTVINEIYKQILATKLKSYP